LNYFGKAGHDKARLPNEMTNRLFLIISKGLLVLYNDMKPSILPFSFKKEASMGDVNKQIGRRIRSLRASRKLTLGKLAEMAKMSEKHLGKVERGTANPSIQCLTDIAEALQLPASAIVEADHERPEGELAAEIIALVPDLSPKNMQIVYRLVTMLADR
jgi:transcriptional regulator with XRE-family HTH domain